MIPTKRTQKEGRADPTLSSLKTCTERVKVVVSVCLCSYFSSLQLSENLHRLFLNVSSNQSVEVISRVCVCARVCERACRVCVD